MQPDADTHPIHPDTYMTKPGTDDIYHVVSIREFDGHRWAICEIASHGLYMDVVQVSEDMQAWPLSSASSFADAVSRIVDSRACLADAKTYGIAVTVGFGRGVESSAVVVRCTKTRWIDSDGIAYRRTGSEWRIGDVIGRTRGRIMPDSLGALVAFVGERECVDIVAERKAANTAE